MRRQNFRIVLAAALLVPFAAAEEKKLRIVCTIPTLRALTEEVGGSRVDVIALAKGDQDPHFVTPTPVLMKRTREAEVFIQNGLSLELWANEVVNGSGNAKIFQGTPGRVVAGAGIPALEIPSILTRELGDIHPQGNPHFWLDPLLAKLEASNICEALKKADPAGSGYYDARRDDFFRRVDEALFGPELLKLIGIQKLTRLAWSGQLHDFLESNKFGGQPLSARAGGWLKDAEVLRGQKAFEFHKVWVYFARVFGIQLVGTIEERPGIPPGPQHVRQVAEQIRAEKIPLILVDNFYDPSLPNNLGAQTGAAVVMLPNQVDGETDIHNYFDLIQHLITEIAGGLKRSSNYLGKRPSHP